MENENNQPQQTKNYPVVQDSGEFSMLMDSGKFEHMQRVAQMFSQSRSLVPAHYRGSIADCLIATQMAVRLGVDPMMFMQNTYLVHGRPGMEAKLTIALINKRGPFKGPIMYEYIGEGDSRTCRAYAVVKETGAEVSYTMTVKVAKAAGWWESNNNWKTITDLMLSYRAATYLGRLYCPEVLMGLQTVDELKDVERGQNQDVKVVDGHVSQPERTNTPTALDQLADGQQAVQEEKGEPGNPFASFTPSAADIKWAIGKYPALDNAAIDAETSLWAHFHKTAGSKFKSLGQAWRKWIDMQYASQVEEAGQEQQASAEGAAQGDQGAQQEPVEFPWGQGSPTDFINHCIDKGHGEAIEGEVMDLTARYNRVLSGEVPDALDKYTPPQGFDELEVQGVWIVESVKAYYQKLALSKASE